MAGELQMYDMGINRRNFPSKRQRKVLLEYIKAYSLWKENRRALIEDLQETVEKLDTTRHRYIFQDTADS